MMVNEEDFLMGKTTCGTKKKWVSVLKKGVGNVWTKKR